MHKLAALMDLWDTDVFKELIWDVGQIRYNSTLSRLGGGRCNNCPTLYPALVAGGQIPDRFLIELQLAGLHFPFCPVFVR